MAINCENLMTALNRTLKGYEKQEKTEFEDISKEIRKRGYLSPTELFYIICWKYPVQGKANAVNYGFESINKHGTEEIRKITSLAFKLAEEDRVKEANETLKQLYGVDVRVASAMLTFYNPEKFGTLDKLAWKALYKEIKESFHPEDYEKYLKDVREIAKRCNMTARQVDLALWEIGKISDP